MKADTQLTLREAFEKHYDKSDLTDRSLESYYTVLKRWERLTGNPPVGEIDLATMAELRQACIDAGLAPATTNFTYKRVRAILRRLGPPENGNVWGLGIIGTAPPMKLVKDVHKRPYNVPQKDLSRLYVYFSRAEFPRCGIPPTDWWRALLVVAYCTALRRGDLHDLTWDQIDLEAGTLDFTSRKSGKADVWPLHPVAIEHLKLIGPPQANTLVFRGMFSGGGGSFHKAFRQLQTEAGIERTFSLHDIRRTAASQIERFAPGLGKEFLQHVPRGVSDVHYLNRYDALKDALEKYPIPDGWKAGPKVAATKAEKARDEKVEMHRTDFEVPSGPDPADWKFRPGQFWLRGQWYALPSPRRWLILQLLATSSEPVTVEQVLKVIEKYPFTGTTDARRRAHVQISQIRAIIRNILGLTDCHDPIPCVSYGDGGAWTIWLPPVRPVRNGGAA